MNFHQALVPTSYPVVCLGAFRIAMRTMLQRQVSRLCSGMFFPRGIARASSIAILTASQCIVKVKQNFAGTLIAAAHSAAPFARRSGVRRLPERSDRSLERALAWHDMTVPSGQSNKVAIS